MKTNLLKSKKVSILLLVSILTGSIVYGTTFTAVTSGNWGSSATWGGTQPSYNINSDHVVIPAGLNVTLDNNVTFSGALSVLNVNGTLSSVSNISLTVNSAASVTGDGTINLGNVILGAAAGLTFSGSLVADTLVSSASGLQVAAGVTAKKAIILTSGILSLGTGGNLNINANGTIIISGGTLSLNGGSIGFSGAYNVDYTQGSVVAGVELSGAGLNNVSINVSSGNSVTLTSDLTVNGTLNLQSGTLDFSGVSVIINGNVSGSGSLSGNSSSNLTINTSGGLSGGLNFATSGQALNNFTINVGSGNSVALSSDLSVNGTLSLSGGSKLDISGVMLTVGADISGSGSLVVNSNSGLTINSNGGITSGISFSGSSIGTLVINAGSGNSVTLGSDLAVSTMLDLQSGILVLNGHNLTIAGDISASGSGTISSTSASNITVSSNSSPSGYLKFTASGNTVNNLTVDIGSSGSVMIGSNVVVQGTLNFMSGNINVGNNNITLGTSGSISGAGSSSYVITGSSGYLGMQLTAGSSGAITFPIGTSIYYAPANVQLNSGSSGGKVMVGVSGDVKAQGSTGTDLSTTQPLVDATWFVQSDISANLNMNLELMWSSAMEVNAFNRTMAYISHYTSASWDMSAQAAATVQSNGMFSLKRNNITSLSPFAVFDGNTNTTVAEIDKNVKIELYPNPASDHIVVKGTSNFTGMIYVDIISIQGQVVEKLKLTDRNSNISLNKLNSGNYFIRFYNDDMNVVKRFSKM